MIDIITVIGSDSIEQISLSNAHQQFLLVEPGRKVEAQSITRHIGGGALNTAVSLKKLGCDVSPVIKTGEDVPRDHVLQHCKTHQLNAENFLVDSEDNTGSAIMIASHEKNAAIFTQRGANTTLIDKDLDRVTPLEADLVHAAPMSGASAKMLPRISELAKEAGAFFSSNPGIRQITKLPNTVLNAARNMSLISINEVEAAALIPCLSTLEKDMDWREPSSNEPIIKTAGGEIALQQFCEVMTARGPNYVLITHGAEGAYLFDGQTLHHQSVIPAKVSGTAGAGDSFVSTLGWALKSGHRCEEALLLAAHNASSVVSFINTTDGLLAKEKLFKRAGL